MRREGKGCQVEPKNKKNEYSKKNRFNRSTL